MALRKVDLCMLKVKLNLFAATLQPPNVYIIIENLLILMVHVDCIQCGFDRYIICNDKKVISISIFLNIKKI